MSEQPDTSDTSNARNRGPLSPEERTRKQTRFLARYRASGNVMHACTYAGIHRSTFYEWRDHDAAFKARLAEVEPDVDDTLEAAAFERAVKGVPSFVVSQGKLVYGPNKKPLIERKYSDTLLVTLMKARMPEKYKDRSQIEHSGAIDVSGAKEQLLERLRRVEGEGRDA